MYSDGTAKRPYAGTGLENGVEQRFTWPVGKPHGVFESLMEFYTVQRAGAKSEGILGVVGPPIPILDGPLQKRHVLIPALAAHLSTTSLLENRAPMPAAFGKACACRTVWFSNRLRARPYGKPHGDGVDWVSGGTCQLFPSPCQVYREGCGHSAHL